MKKIDKILTNWFIAFLVISFLLERIWNQIFTPQIAFYSYLVNGIIMVAVKIIYEVFKKNNKK